MDLTHLLQWLHQEASGDPLQWYVSPQVYWTWNWQLPSVPQVEGSSPSQGFFSHHFPLSIFYCSFSVMPFSSHFPLLYPLFFIPFFLTFSLLFYPILFFFPSYITFFYTLPSFLVFCSHSLLLSFYSLSTQYKI